jgi:hypothetical protein
MFRTIRRLFAVCLLVALAACSDALSPEDFYDVWGAEGVKLTLSPTLARFETPCWAGDLAIPIQVDGDRFTAIGNVQFRGGAGSTESRAVILQGHLDDDELRLTVETSFQLGPFTLRRANSPEIAACPLTP